MNIEPASTPPSSSGFNGGSAAGEEFSTFRDLSKDAEDEGMEIDWKGCSSLARPPRTEESREKQKKRRPRPWISDVQRMPKVRRVLSIETESERDVKTLPVVFVPITPSNPFVRTVISLGKEDTENRAVIDKISKKLGLTSSEIVLRFVNGEVFQQISNLENAQIGQIVAYQVPRLRTRVNKIERFLKTLPKSLIKNFQVLNSIMYHRPYRIIRMLETIQDCHSDTKRIENSKLWLGRIFHVDFSLKLSREFCKALDDVRSFIRETSSIEQYSLLVVAVQQMGRWKYITMPQYVPYTVGLTTFQELREQAHSFVRRALASKPGYSSLFATRSLNFSHTGSRCYTKEKLTLDAKLQPFPEPGDDHVDRTISSRISMILCDLS